MLNPIFSALGKKNRHVVLGFVLKAIDTTDGVFLKFEMFLALSLDSKLWSVLSPFQYYLVNAGCKIVLSPIPSFISRSTSRRASARV